MASLRDLLRVAKMVGSVRFLAMASAPVLDVPNTFGATLIGSFFACMLYGLTTLQTYLYYTLYPKDTIENKLLVSVVWFLDTLHVACITFSLYYYLVANYNNPFAMLIGHWSLFLSIGLNTVIACIVQAYFVVRIFYLSPKKLKWWITSVIGVTVIAHLAFGMETVVLMFIKKELAKLSELDLYPALQFAILCVLSDLLIAGALIYLLRGHRSGIRKTDNLVATLIFYAVNRFLLTSIVEIAELIAALALPRSLWFIGIDFVIGKLYANSFLASLNSRAGLGDRSGSTINSVHLSELNFQECDEEQAEVRILKSFRSTK